MKAPATLERIEITRNPEGIKIGKQTAQAAQRLLTNALKQWQALKLGDLTLDKLFELATTPGGLEKELRHRIYEASAELKKLPLARQQVMQMIEMPQGFASADAAFSAILEALKAVHHSQYNPYNPHLFTLEGNTVVIRLVLI